MHKSILAPLALDHGVGETSVDIARPLLADGGRMSPAPFMWRAIPNSLYTFHAHARPGVIRRSKP
jgi:hypothetical protein